jgi:hypothetical protein
MSANSYQARQLMTFLILYNFSTSKSTIFVSKHATLPVDISSLFR